jgi:hypothetical protein
MTPNVRPVVVNPPNYANSPLLYSSLVDGKYITFKREQIQPIDATRTNILDPFGPPYNYYCNPIALDQTNRPTFDLWSYGPDGKNDTADDIVNWRR